MILFSIIMGMIGAFYSMFIVEIYTRLSARARDARERSNDIVRFFLFIVVVPVLFGPLGFAMAYAQKMFFSEPSPMSAAKHHSTVIQLGVWLGLLWVFLIVRWRVITARLRAKNR